MAQFADAVAAIPRRDPANIGTTLKLRLSLIISALLAIVTLAGGAYVVRKARDAFVKKRNPRSRWAGHFLDAEIGVVHAHWALHGFELPYFKLRELGPIRHLSVKFYDFHGRLLESNEQPGSRSAVAPRWFAALIRIASPPLGI